MCRHDQNQAEEDFSSDYALSQQFDYGSPPRLEFHDDRLMMFKSQEKDILCKLKSDLESLVISLRVTDLRMCRHQFSVCTLALAMSKTELCCLLQRMSQGFLSILHLPREAELAYSLRNLMNSTIQHALSQASSSRKINHNDQSIVSCECEDKLFLAAATDCRQKGSQSIQYFIPCECSTEFYPCRMASVLYSLYLFEELHEDPTVLGRIIDIIRTSFCGSNFKFSYHSSSVNARGHHYHGTLSLSLLAHSKESSLGSFEMVYCSLKACFPSKDWEGAAPNKKQQSGLSPNPDSVMVPSSSNDRLMLLDSLQTLELRANRSGESIESIADIETNNQHTRKESNTKWSAGGSISLQDIVKHYGKKKRKEAAESLQVSVSTFKRLCKQHGISRWPSTKGKSDKSFLFTQKSFLSAVQPFPAYSTAIETHQESSLFPIQSNHSEGDQAHYHNMPQERATTNKSTLSIENLMPDSLEKMCRPPQTCLACDDDSGTSSSTSSRKRKRLEKETDCIKKVTRCEEQPSQTQNCVSNSITGHIGVQPSVEPISTQPSLSSFSCNDNTSKNTKLVFNNLIALSLKELIDPENETSMKKALSILVDNLSLFSREQAEQILGLSLEFPALVHSWREYSLSQMLNQKSLAETEKIRDLVETSAKDEESLKVRYEELESKEKELMTQLEEVQKEKAGIAEQMNEKAKKAKQLVSLAEEKAASRSKEKHMMKIATNKLNNLVDQWAKIQSFFI